MRNFMLWLTSTCLITIATISLFAQNPAPQRGKDKEPVVGIVLDSDNARILAFLPKLKDSLVKTIPQRRKQIRVVAWDAGYADVEDVAKSKSCDYLLEIFVLETRGEGAGDSANLPSKDISSEEERDRRELGSVHVEYHLRSLAEKSPGEPKFQVVEPDSVRPVDCPSAWDASAFETTVSRSVTRVAIASVGKLPKQ